MTEGNEHEPLDAAVLENLRALQREGGPDIVATLIVLFLDTAKPMLTRLQDAANSDDHDGLHRASHSLGSMSANVGAMLLAKRCKELAQQARASSVSNLSGQVDAIVVEYQRVEAALVLHLIKPADAGQKVSA